MTAKAKFDAIPDVDIDQAGTFKYVLIKVHGSEKDDFKYITRGYSWGEFHGITFIYHKCII